MGDIFELDRNEISLSFDKLDNCSGERYELPLKSFAYWSPYLVASLLLDDEFISNIVNTVIDDKPCMPDIMKNAKYNFAQTTQLLDINFEEYNETLWKMFFDIAKEGFKAYEELFDIQALLIKDINIVRSEFVQIILNHIGVVVYHLWKCEPFNIYINSVLVNYPKWIVEYYESEWRPKHENKEET